jgi:hypothetical protein
MSSEKLTINSQCAILFHCSNDNSYNFYILRDELCVAVFSYTTVEEALCNLELFARRDCSSFMEGKNDLSKVNQFNQADCLYEVPGIQIGVVTSEDIVIYPGQVPIEDKDKWAKALMHNFSISIARSSFSL